MKIDEEKSVHENTNIYIYLKNLIYIYVLLARTSASLVSMRVSGRPCMGDAL